MKLLQDVHFARLHSLKCKERRKLGLKEFHPRQENWATSKQLATMTEIGL